MVLFDKDKNSKNILIINCKSGFIYNYVKSFDTVTKRAEFYATINFSKCSDERIVDKIKTDNVFTFSKKKVAFNNGDIITFNCKIKDAIAINVETLEEIK